MARSRTALLSVVAIYATCHRALVWLGDAVARHHSIHAPGGMGVSLRGMSSHRRPRVGMKEASDGSFDEEADENLGFGVGDDVACRDSDEKWRKGRVASVSPLMIETDDIEPSVWDEVRSWEEMEAVFEAERLAALEAQESKEEEEQVNETWVPKIGERVECRSKMDSFQGGNWSIGTVTSVEPLVLINKDTDKNGFATDFFEVQLIAREHIPDLLVARHEAGKEASYLWAQEDYVWTQKGVDHYVRFQLPGILAKDAPVIREQHELICKLGRTAEELLETDWIKNDVAFAISVDQCGEFRATGRWKRTAFEDERGLYEKISDSNTIINWCEGSQEWHLIFRDAQGKNPKTMYSSKQNFREVPSTGWNTVDGAAPPPSLQVKVPVTWEPAVGMQVFVTTDVERLESECKASGLNWPNLDDGAPQTRKLGKRGSVEIVDPKDNTVRLDINVGGGRCWVPIRALKGFSNYFN